MEDAANLARIVAWGGFAIGLVIGFVGNRTDFCAMGAVSDVVNMGDWRRMRMWLLAIGIAIIGANGLELLGYINLDRSLYRTANFTWLSYLVGGFLFGAGMTLASGCGTKTLIRIGNGNLKAIVVFLVLGLAAYMTLRGVLGVVRVAVLEPHTVWFPDGQALPSLLGRATGIDRETLQIVLAGLLGAGLIAFALSRSDCWTNDHLLGGGAIGLAIVAGWYVTGYLGYGENPETLEMVSFGTNSQRPESVTNVVPFAYTLELLMFWTDASRKVTFAIAVVIGIVLGSFFQSLRAGRFRLEGFRTAADTGNHLVGGVLMGFGGVVALGCTFGQGITGVSTLALGSILTFFSIVAGAALTMKYQYWRIMRGGSA